MIPNTKTDRSIFYKSMLITSVLMGSLICIVVIIMGLADKKVGDRIYPNVFIDNQEVGNLTMSEAQQLFAQKQKTYSNIALTTFYKKDPIATLSAQSIKLRLNTDETLQEAYRIGRDQNQFTKWQQKLATILGVRNYHLNTKLVYDRAPVLDFVSTAEDTYNKPAKNALFSFQDNRVTEFRPEENGIKVESEKYLSEFDTKIQSLKQSPKNLTFTLNVAVSKPEITLAQANDLGIEELIGEGKSDYTGSIPEREHNVVLGTSRFNGVLIPKGETFSFNQTVGDISSLTGFKPAYVIQNGKTVLGDGGGICQVSTTFFRAALNTGLPIVNRVAHAYRVSYYENDSGPGYDATIFTPTVDLKVKNDTPGAILIQTEVDQTNKLVFFRMYGKKDGRKVEISKSEVWDVAPPPEPSYEDDPTLQRGITKQVDFAAWGAKARFNYKVVYPNKEVKEESFYSVYRPWRAVFLVGTKDS